MLGLVGGAPGWGVVGNVVDQVGYARRLGVGEASLLLLPLAERCSLANQCAAVCSEPH